MNRTLIVSVTLVVSIMAATAEEMNTSGRYTLERTESGFLRLDRETGAISMCSERAGGKWACEVVADDRLALQAEIDRLGAEIGHLQSEVDAARDKGRETGGLNLPSRDDVDEMMDVMEDILTRFKGMTERLERRAPKSEPEERIPPGAPDKPDRT